MTTQSSAQGVQLKFSTKLFYGLASLGASTISGIYAALLPIFYQDYLGVSAHWIGIASLLYAIWNAINDPLFGHITDKTHSRLGRRIPYLRFTAPFLGLTFVLVWLAPPDASQITKFIWMLVTMLLYDTCYTIIGLVHGALMPEISESDLERTQLTISSTLFGLVGTLLGFVIPDFFRPKAGSMDTSLLSLQLSMVAVGVIGAFLIILTTLKVKERKEFAVVDTPLSLVQSLKYTLTSKSFLIFVAMNFMGTLMLSMSTGGNLLPCRLRHQIQRHRIDGLLIHSFGCVCATDAPGCQAPRCGALPTNLLGHIRFRAVWNGSLSRFAYPPGDCPGWLWALWHADPNLPAPRASNR